MSRIFKEVLRRTFFDYAAVVHEDNAVCHLTCEAHLVSYDNHSYVVLA